jgi:hypothetical protein
MRPDLPAALTALLHTWAHKPVSNWTRVGVWDVQRRSLRTGVPAEPERAIRIGINELGEWLVVTWTPDGSTPVWSYDPRTGGLRALAPSLERFLGGS